MRSRNDTGSVSPVRERARPSPRPSGPGRPGCTRASGFVQLSSPSTKPKSCSAAGLEYTSVPSGPAIVITSERFWTSARNRSSLRRSASSAATRSVTSRAGDDDAVDRRVVEQVVADRLEVPPRAVGVTDPHPDRTVDAGLGERLGQDLGDHRLVLRVHELERVETGREALGVAEHLVAECAAVPDRPVRVDQRDRVGGVLHDRAEQLFARRGAGASTSSFSSTSSLSCAVGAARATR